jgi:hypothetical protein
VLRCTALLQGLVLDVKGILGARTDVPALLAQMITPPEPAALLQGVQWLWLDCCTAGLLCSGAQSILGWLPASWHWCISAN